MEDGPFGVFADAAEFGLAGERLAPLPEVSENLRSAGWSGYDTLKEALVNSVGYQKFLAEENLRVAKDLLAKCHKKKTSVAYIKCQIAVYYAEQWLGMF